MAGTCSKCGGEEWFWWGHPKERDNFEALGRDGRMILKWIVKRTVRGLVLIHLAKDMDKLRAVANAVMNPRVPYNAM